MVVCNELSAEMPRGGVDIRDHVLDSLSEDVVATQQAATCACWPQGFGVCRKGAPLDIERVRLPHNGIQLGYGGTLRRRPTLIGTNRRW